MKPLLLSGSLSGLEGLAPFFIAPVALIIGVPSIFGVRHLHRRDGTTAGILLFLLSIPNLWLGGAFLGIIHDVVSGITKDVETRYWILIYVAYACSGVMVISGGYALWVVLRRIYRGTAKAYRDRVG